LNLLQSPVAAYILNARQVLLGNGIKVGRGFKVREKKEEVKILICQTEG